MDVPESYADKLYMKCCMFMVEMEEERISLVGTAAIVMNIRVLMRVWCTTKFAKLWMQPRKV